MILADTSAWVEYDRGTGSSVDLRVSQLLFESGPLAVTEPIIMEVSAGARSDKGERDLRRLLGHCALLPFDSAVDFDAATRIYRTCRRSGITVRGMLDCMIASVALRYEATILSFDIDLCRMARIFDIDVDAASFTD